jgi:hypothetical protein
VIEVDIKSSRRVLAKIRMECIQTYSDGAVADYSIQIVVDCGAGEVLAVQRKVEAFPRWRYNVLGLLQLGLDTLTEKELYLADEARIDAARSPDLGRRLDRALRALQVG